MVKARTWFSLFIMGVVTIAATASCGSDEGTGGAAGGGVIGDGGSSGLLGTGRGGAVGRAGSNSAGTGTVPSSNSKLGAKCTTDKQCDDGMVCIAAGSTEWSVGGPPGGMCTLVCAGDSDCTALEPGSGCINFGTTVAPKPYCVDGCTQATDPNTDPTKCQARDDIACTDLSSSATPEPFCLPRCIADSQCGTGLYCNKGTGFCSKTKPPAGDPVGTACTPGTTDANGDTVPGSDNCEGICLRTTADGVKPAKGVCAELCEGLLGCAYQDDKPTGLCFGPLSASFGLLDLGYCLPGCGCTNDCPFPGDKCRGWASTEQSFAEEVGAPGLCFNDTSGSVELSTCTDGSSGAGGASGVTPGGEAGASGSSGSAG